MAYAQVFDATLPSATQNGTLFAQSTRYNILAMRDYLVAMGGMSGWNFSKSGGTAEQPATIYYTRGVEIVAVTLTWGVSAGAAGNVTKMAFYYSSNSGGAYDGMVDGNGYFVCALDYDASGNLLITTWGLTP